MDPHQRGDDHANRPPDRDRDGRPVLQHPERDHNGRYIPPSRDHAGRIDRDDYRRNIHGIQDHWNRFDHDYHWYDWNGTRVCHRYDGFGYHWWGFYIGDVYFWTRYDNDRYWWYDPYFHRWTYLHDGRWWWQDSFGVVYIVINNHYYRYGQNGGTIIVTPDPAPPVEAPPADPTETAPTAETMFYSEDGTRSVQIMGDRNEAYLYDLTVEDQADPKAGGRWLGAGVKSASFVYDDKIGSDGTTTKSLRQIALTFEEAGKSAVADINGEREVTVSGPERGADLYNLKDDAVEPVALADGATSVNLINEESVDASGETVAALKTIILTADEGAGVEATLMFDRDGAPYGAFSAPSPASETREFKAKVQSPTLRTLSNGVDWR